MITVKDLTKYFGSFQALNNVSFHIKEGEIVGFLGQNGAGKTTLMRILTSFLSPSSGEVFIGGANAFKNSLAVRRQIGYLPETPPLYVNMSVVDYLKFAAKLKSVPSRMVKTQVDRVLSDCQLEDMQYKTISILSKGYKQRVGIAQAIINDPKVLILDEPISGLDPVQIFQVRRLIKNLEYKRTVILSTHILPEIEKIVKRVMVIKEGQIIADQLIEKLLESEQKVFTLKVEGEEAVIRKILEGIRNISNVKVECHGNICKVQVVSNSRIENLNAIVGFLIKSDLKVLEIKEDMASLEEKFIQLTQSK